MLLPGAAEKTFTMLQPALCRSLYVLYLAVPSEAGGAKTRRPKRRKNFGMAQLSQSEADACRQVFAQYDTNGVVPVDHLSGMLSALGFGADDVVSAQSRVADLDTNEGLDFDRFLKIVQSQRETNTAVVDETDTVEAFVALGGKADRSGKVVIDKLRNTIKEFELTIDLDNLLADLDKEQTGSIDYKEFKSLLE